MIMDGVDKYESNRPVRTRGLRPRVRIMIDGAVAWRHQTTIDNILLQLELIKSSQALQDCFCQCTNATKFGYLVYI